MAELIFQGVWWEPQSIWISYITMFFHFFKSRKCFRYSQYIISKFFLLYTKIPRKEEFRISCCSKQESLFHMEKKDKSTEKYVKEFYLSLITIYLASLAWLIQEYIFFNKKVITVVLFIQILANQQTSFFTLILFSFLRDLWGHVQPFQNVCWLGMVYSSTI